MADIQFDFVVPEILNYGDIEDVVRLVEPAHLLILGGEEDKWSLGTQAMIDFARSAFKRGTLEGQVYAGGHQFTPQMRRRAYAFLTQHLGTE